MKSKIEQKQKKKMRANGDYVVEKGKQSPQLGGHLIVNEPFKAENQKGSPILKYQPPNLSQMREAILLKKQDLQKLVRLIDK